ncbi:MAG: sugar phosphate isomerase/epimerase family protein [Tissierella sp.]|uniref:sugar phosphate isomerase/epimerase family protein n=1 Tax=Tissierella sp. TaxID=41274 RepID=UPI003F94E168
MKTLLKAVSIIDDFHINLFNKLDIGVEIQDFTESNLNIKEKDSLIRRYKKLFKNFRGTKALHAPFLDLKPASPDLAIRDISFHKYLNTLDICYKLEMDFVIFHSQINPYLNEPFIRDLNNRQNKEFWDKILDKSKYNGTILIENIFEESPKMLKEYIETINKENIKINLDIGHAKLGKVSLEEWIKELKDYIVYMHIHSNDGLYDKHNSPNKEEIKYLYNLLEKYDINPLLSLEYKTDNLENEILKYR